MFRVGDQPHLSRLAFFSLCRIPINKQGWEENLFISVFVLLHTYLWALSQTVSETETYLRVKAIMLEMFEGHNFLKNSITQ